MKIKQTMLVLYTQNFAVKHILHYVPSHILTETTLKLSEPSAQVSSLRNKLIGPENLI